MGDILKVLAISFLIMAAITAAGNYYYGAGGCMQVINVSENSINNDRFIAVTNAYDDRLEFSYVLREAAMNDDYYISYTITADGNTLEFSGRQLRENVTVKEPVMIIVPRQSSSLYEMEMLVEDMQGNAVHRSTIRIGPQAQ
ncbi:MAG: hypothetical protein PWR29_568 [Methanolobus sp.]|nr:hypothetical protein [Methanolobus sp.]MDK2911611.1 hypothetical protein [Methanolobus sp.]MDN5308955.1 hypothetical protein [Methanolobus sp.]